MKKKYILPEMNIDSLEVEQMISVSVPVDDEPATGDQAEGKDEYYNSDLWG